MIDCWWEDEERGAEPRHVARERDRAKSAEQESVPRTRRKTVSARDMR